MRVNSALLKHFEFLTTMFDGMRNFLYSPVLLYLQIRGSSISERGGIFVVGSNWKNLCSNCLLWYNISMNWLLLPNISLMFLLWVKINFRGASFLS